MKAWKRPRLVIYILHEIEKIRVYLHRVDEYTRGYLYVEILYVYRDTKLSMISCEWEN